MIKLSILDANVEHVNLRMMTRVMAHAASRMRRAKVISSMENLPSKSIVDRSLNNLLVWRIPETFECPPGFS
jgi:hypothetical protein